MYTDRVAGDSFELSDFTVSDSAACAHLPTFIYSVVSIDPVTIGQSTAFLTELAKGVSWPAGLTGTEIGDYVVTVKADSGCKTA